MTTSSAATWRARLRWLIAIPVAVLLGAAAGTAWWFGAGEGLIHSAALESDAAKQLVFTGDDLANFIVAPSASDRLPLTLDPISIEYAAPGLVATPVECSHLWERVTDAPAGYREVSGTYSAGGGPASIVLFQQSVYQFATLAGAADAYEKGSGAVAGCSQFVEAAPDGGRASDATSHAVELSAGKRQIYAGAGIYDGYEQANIGWVLLRQNNVISVVFLYGSGSVRDFVSDELVRDVASQLQARADEATRYALVGAQQDAGSGISEYKILGGAA